MKNITKAALLVFVCAAFSACSNGNDNSNSIDPDNEQIQTPTPDTPQVNNPETIERTIVTQMTTINSELTFYSDNTFVLKEEQASALQRAVSSGASESQGTYEGDVKNDEATADLQFTSGHRKDKKATTVVDHWERQIHLTYEGGGTNDYTIIHVPVSVWRSDTTTAYFYDDLLAMLVIRDGSKNAYHPLAYTGDAGKDGDLQLTVLDDGNEHKVYKTATIAGSTMTYDEATYTKINNDKMLATAWFAASEEDGIRFFEYMYFYDDGTFMIVMTKIDGTIANGYAGTYKGDTTKDGTVYATIEGQGDSLPGIISNNTLSIERGTIYNRIL